MGIADEPQLVGVIGVGHFGKALVEGLISSKQYNVKCSNLTPYKFIEPTLKEIKVITDNIQLSQDVETLVIAVRPQDVEVVLEDIKDFKGLIITFAAGLPLSYYEGRLPNACVVRGMSNLGVAYQRGMSAWVVSEAVTHKQLIYIKSFFSQLGNHIHYPLSQESNLNIVTALSGSGIGYLAKIFDIMRSWGASQGLSDEDSEQIVVETVRSLIELYGQSDLNLGEIGSHVASEGGTTQAGLKIMHNKGLSLVISEGLQETISKCLDLSDI